MTKVFLIRHATNDALKDGLIYGRSPGVHLNDEGRVQAEALAERLSTVELVAVYSSPLERARETAGPLAERHGLEVIVHHGLIETDAGEWTGQSLEEVQQLEAWDQLMAYPAGVPLPDGESLWQVQVRMVQAAAEIRAAHGEGIVAVVSHADPLRVLVAHYLGLPLGLFRRLTISPASITVFDFHASVPRLICLNDRGHVPVFEAEAD
ncbi:MAG: histidine phosphatase family protein [Anaerolineae bacterium]|jgi:probable phosphoglycerate mutase